MKRDGKRCKKKLVRFFVLSIALLIAFSAFSTTTADAREDMESSSGGGFRLTWKSGAFPGIFKHASPTIADLNGDGRKEILIGNKNHHLYCISADGDVLWTQNVGGDIQGKPLAADVDGDGKMEVWVGSENGYVYGFRHNGEPLSEWGWPKYAGDGLTPTQDVFASVTCGDITGDGNLEIVTASWGRIICAWHYYGPMVAGFPFDNKDSIWSSPVCADLTRDGRDEIIVGACCWGNRERPHAWYKPGGLIWVLRGDGSVLPGWPKEVPQVIWSSPAIADLDGDGYLDIIVGTGHFYQNTNPALGTYLSYADGRYVYAFNHWGESLSGWPVTTEDDNFSSPAIADIDGDGNYEVLNASLDGYLYCWEHDGTLKWKVTKWGVDVLASPVIADVDGDGIQDIIIGNSRTLCIWNAYGNLKYTAELDGIIFSTAAVGDLNGNGKINVVAACGADENNDAGHLYIFEGGPVRGDIDEAVPWGMFRKNHMNRAVIERPVVEPGDAWPSSEIKSSWHFAEGYTGPGFDTWILMMNPLDREVQVQVRFMGKNPPSKAQMYTIKPNSRMTIHANEFMRGDVSTRIISNEAGVVAERAMYFDYAGKRGGSCSIGAKEPSLTWYLAEGYTGDQFDEYLCLLNSDPENSATVKVTYMTENGPVDGGIHSIGSRSRYTIHVDSVLPAHNVSIKVESLNSVGVVAERSLYFKYKGIMGGGSVTIGTDEPQKKWYFSEGYTGGKFDTYVLIQNPNSSPTNCKVTFMRDDGENFEKRFAINAESRFTVCANNEAGTENAAFSFTVEADKPVIAERSMYFDYEGLTGGHCTIGSHSISDRWLLAEGYTAQSYDTWILLLNPNDEQITANIRFMRPDGFVVNQDIVIGGNARATVSVDAIPGFEATEVSTEIRTNGKPIMAERAMYFDSSGRGGGHVTIGCSL